MGRENKKAAIAAFHRVQITQAAEALFSEKGFEQTTIEDISRASEYSRRTIYAYYESKDDILHHIIEGGLQSLEKDIESALENNRGFMERYKAICLAMVKYQTECPHSLDGVIKAKSPELDPASLSDTVKRILNLGTRINGLIAGFVQQGKEDGIIRQNVQPLLSVYIMWSSLTSFITLVQTKGQFICGQLGLSQDELYDRGFRQILDSILEVRN